MLRMCSELQIKREYCLSIIFKQFQGFLKLPPPPPPQKKDKEKLATPTQKKNARTANPPPPSNHFQFPPP